jgi:tRNA(fMet)-specific endonuclease VapC
MAGQKYRAVNQQTLNRFLTYYKALPWPHDAAKSYAATRFALVQKGNMIGANDLLIASHALRENLTVVTNNTREFMRVAGLSVENWTSSD